MSKDFFAKFGNSTYYKKDDFEVHETELYIKNITKPMTINIYSDIHIAFTDRRDDLARRNFVMQRRIYFPGAPDVLLQAVTYNKKNHPDFTVFCGDIIDFPSDSNIEALSVIDEPGFGPYLYHLGNHDYNFPNEKAASEEIYSYRARIDEHSIDKTNKFADVTPSTLKNSPNGFHAVDLGEFIIAGGDNITSEGIKAICEGLSELGKINKPVILSLHNPLYAETLEPDIFKVWGKIGKRQHVTDYMACNDKLVAVFSGHVHFFHNDLADGLIPQIVVTSTESKYHDDSYGDWPFYYSGMGVVKILPLND